MSFVKIDRYKIGFVGFGHLAQILCKSITLAKLIPRSQILFVRRDPKKILNAQKEFGITSASLDTVVTRSDLILFCVRPGQAEEVLKELRPLDLSKKMAISVMAGVSSGYFEKILGSLNLVRAMPNIAMEVGESMTVLAPSKHSSNELKSLTQVFFASLGKTMELPESCMDVATALCGSGPAFVFRLIEAMAMEAEKEGVPKEKALQMAAQTFLGAAKMLLAGETSLQDLQRQIASPGGTTEAGLRVFHEMKIGEKLQDVVRAASSKAKFIS